MNIKEKFYAKLDEISGAKARKAEHASAEVYHRAYDDETRERRKAIRDRTPESKDKAEKAKEKREKAAKRTIRFQNYADKKEKKLEEGAFSRVGKMMMKRKLKKEIQGHAAKADDALNKNAVPGMPMNSNWDEKTWSKESGQENRKKKALKRLEKK